MLGLCIIMSLGLWTLINAAGRARAHARCLTVLCKSNERAVLRDDGASLVPPSWAPLNIDKLSFVVRRTSRWAALVPRDPGWGWGWCRGGSRNVVGGGIPFLKMKSFNSLDFRISESQVFKV